MDAENLSGPFGEQYERRLIDPAAVAELLGVLEADVLAWVRQGTISYELAPDGAPRFPIYEAHEVSEGGAASTTMVFHSIGAGPNATTEQWTEQLARAQRDRFDTDNDTGPVNPEALADALQRRLAQVLPPRCTASASVSVDGIKRTTSYTGATLNERVCTACSWALESAQDDVVMETAERWPPGAPGLPDPWATTDGDRVRLGYGDPADPILELEPIPLADVRR